MAPGDIGSSGKVLQKLVDYVEETIEGPPPGRAQERGAPIIEWITRRYPYVNEEQQEFRVICKTPKTSENEVLLNEFCKTIAFAGSCVGKKDVENQTLPEMNAATGTQSVDGIFQLEIDFEVIDPKAVEPPYTVTFDFDPEIPFFDGSASIRHRLMKEGVEGKNLNLTVTSSRGEFNAYVTPTFPLSGTLGEPKAVSMDNVVQFIDSLDVGRHYLLWLDLDPGDVYSLFGWYDV